jgi:hypothetical protein
MNIKIKKSLTLTLIMLFCFSAIIGLMNFNKVSARPSSVPNGVKYYVPITFTNSQSGSIASGTQISFSINWNTYSSYLDNPVNNYAFFNSLGSILNSWIESGTANTATALVWIVIDSNIPATTGIWTCYLGFYALGSNQLSATGNTGEFPTATGTYGQFDNGAKVFTSYYNFAGITIPSGLTEVVSYGSVTFNNGVTIKGATSAVHGENGLYITISVLPITTMDFYGILTTSPSGSTYGYNIFGYSNYIGATVNPTDSGSTYALTDFEHGTYGRAMTDSTTGGTVINGTFHAPSSGNLYSNSVWSCIEGSNGYWAYKNYNIPVGNVTSFTTSMITSLYPLIVVGNNEATYASNGMTMQWLRTRLNVIGRVMPSPSFGSVTVNNYLSPTVYYSSYTNENINNTYLLQYPSVFDNYLWIVQSHDISVGGGGVLEKCSTTDNVISEVSLNSAIWDAYPAFVLDGLIYIPSYGGSPRCGELTVVNEASMDIVAFMSFPSATCYCLTTIVYDSLRGLLEIGGDYLQAGLYTVPLADSLIQSDYILTTISGSPTNTIGSVESQIVDFNGLIYVSEVEPCRASYSGSVETLLYSSSDLSTWILTYSSYMINTPSYAYFPHDTASSTYMCFGVVSDTGTGISTYRIEYMNSTSMTFLEYNSGILENSGENHPDVNALAFNNVDNNIFLFEPCAKGNVMSHTVYAFNATSGIATYLFTITSTGYNDRWVGIDETGSRLFIADNLETSQLSQIVEINWNLPLQNVLQPTSTPTPTPTLAPTSTPNNSGLNGLNTFISFITSWYFLALCVFGFIIFLLLVSYAIVKDAGTSKGK